MLINKTLIFLKIFTKKLEMLSKYCKKHKSNNIRVEKKKKKKKKKVMLELKPIRKIMPLNVALMLPTGPDDTSDSVSSGPAQTRAPRRPVESYKKNRKTNNKIVLNSSIY